MSVNSNQVENVFSNTLEILNKLLDQKELINLKPGLISLRDGLLEIKDILIDHEKRLKELEIQYNIHKE